MLNSEKIKKLKAGELVGYVFAAVSAAAFVYFIVGFVTAQVLELETFKIAVLISAPSVMVLCAGVSAYCNLKYGTALEREIKAYVRGVLIDNAALLHPERDSLSFYVNSEGGEAYIKVNGYKDKITFDFSALGKTARLSSLASVITSTLGAAFCRLAERGSQYKSVECSVNGKKSVKIIENGVPDKKIYREYLKTR